eukprot:4960647-Pleurochrysis_carterae.AAC.11
MLAPLQPTVAWPSHCATGAVRRCAAVRACSRPAAVCAWCVAALDARDRPTSHLPAPYSKATERTTVW